MKLAVVGSRGFDDCILFEKTMAEFNKDISTIISGGAEGADNFAEIWANKNKKKLIIYKPEWSKYGKSAGIIRNKKIIEECNYCLVFWDGISKGTKSSIDFCKKFSKDHKIIYFN